MTTQSERFDDSDLPSAVLRGLVGRTVWNDGAIGFHLEAGDFDDNGVNDWDEDGAGDALRLTFDLWAAVADLSFFETSRENATLVERISDADSEPDSDLITLGFHFLPGGNGGEGLRRGEQSDGEYNQNAAGWTRAGLTQGGSGFSTIIHEIGHALGLEHPFDDDLFIGLSGESFGDFGAFGLNQSAFSVMSYNRGLDANGGRSDSRAYGHAGTPLALDIAAVQAIYGANLNHATGDDTYTLADVNASGTFYASVWDAGGNDTFAYDGDSDASIFLDEATIDDTPTGGGLVSYIEGVFGGLTVARGTVIENARTGSGDDVVGGNDAANTLQSGDGNDIVFGLGGDDVIYGGAGDDILIGDYESVTTFGFEVTPEPVPFTGPSLPGGTSTGDGQITVSRFTANTSRATAVDIGNDFALRSRADIEEGEQLFSASVNAVTGFDGFAYYRIDFDTDARLTIDIDGAWAESGGADAFDSFIELLDANGRLVLDNDDGGFDDVGSVDLEAIGRPIDSFLDLTLDAGTYFIKVGQWLESGQPAFALDAGAEYTLHVIADGYTVETPDLPDDPGFAQIGYYYETPDFSDVIGGFNRGAEGDGRVVEQTDKDGNPGHWHRTEDGGRVWHAEAHEEGCACCGCTGEAAENDGQNDAQAADALFATDETIFTEPPGAVLAAIPLDDWLVA